ncbi:YfcL family protein [Alishewanella sp. d11]|uniref:YfcL family protein n=1 Tax=Alishewanella sp. d11 TaxID=3414030 RepID=UPI003BF78F24
MTDFSVTAQFIQQAADFFDELVPVATDDQLFAAGYLRGHLDLVVGTLQLTEQPFSVATVVEQVEQSLLAAIEKGELNTLDEQHVRTVWQQLLQSNKTFLA